MREVKKFQAASGLTVDGICGPMTWAALDTAVGTAASRPSATLYTVHIPHQTENAADGLIRDYPGSWKAAE